LPITEEANGGRGRPDDVALHDFPIKYYEVNKNK
jgi:hypothetical protein